MNWETWRLETEDELEKRAEWCKNTKEIQEERKADQMERSQCKKNLAWECQCRPCALVKEQNPKPEKQAKNINDVS